MKLQSVGNTQKCDFFLLSTFFILFTHNTTQHPKRKRDLTRDTAESVCSM